MKTLENIKVGIVGFFGYGNAGDEAMKEILLSQFPNSVANNQGDMPKCDAYIYAGGNLVQNKSGFHMAEILENITTEPLYVLSLGAGSGWQEQKAKAKSYLEKFRLIYTREKQSRQELNEIVKVNGVMPDLVLLADSPASAEKYPILFNYTRTPDLTENGQFKDIMSQKEMLPVGLSSRNFDSEFSKEIVGYKTFISMAKSSDGVIGTRLHAVVMGVIAGVPVAGIAYDEKVSRFCQRYNIPCFEYGKLNGREIVRSMKKADIDLESERKEIRSVIETVKNDILNYFNS